MLTRDEWLTLALGLLMGLVLVGTFIYSIYLVLA